MADWDVLGPVDGQQELEEEEEFFEYTEEEEYGEYQYTTDYPEFMPSASPVYPASAAPLRESPMLKDYVKCARYDRLHYRHKRGDGIRKARLQTGQDIADQLYLYEDGCGSYNDRVSELRLSNAEDLMGEIGDANNVRDMTTGAGSKIITITKVAKGSFRKHHGNIHAVLKNEKISQKTDLDSRHYYDHVSHELMEDGQFVQAKYDSFREKAINERAVLGIGKSKEMNSLYCFWCFYLRTHFNEDMYEEFLRTAREDLAEKDHYGIECFFRFASYGLETTWNESVYHDFEEEAMNDYNRGSLYGMEKLKAFHLNHHHSFEIQIKPEVKAILDKYPTTKSFHEDRRPHKKSAPRSASSAVAAAMAAAPAAKPRFQLGGQKQPERPQASVSSTAGRPERQDSGKNPTVEKKKRSGGNSRGKGKQSGEKKDKKPVQSGWALGACTQPASLPFDSPMRRKWA